MEGLQAELAEIDENFVRADLETLEFGKLLLRRKEIYEMLHPQVKNGGDRKSEKIRTRRARSDSDKSFVRDTADKLGISTRSVEEKIQIARDMTPRAQEIIQDADRKIKKKDLVKLSRMEPEQQEQAAAQLAAGEIRSADEFPPAEPPASPTVPYSLGDKHYDTLEESIADLKNPDKDCSYTPDTLLADIGAADYPVCGPFHCKGGLYGHSNERAKIPRCGAVRAGLPAYHRARHHPGGQCFQRHKDGKRSHPRSRRKENPLRHKQLKYVCNIVRSSRLSA